MSTGSGITPGCVVQPDTMTIKFYTARTAVEGLYIEANKAYVTKAENKEIVNVST